MATTMGRGFVLLKFLGRNSPINAQCHVQTKLLSTSSAFQAKQMTVRDALNQAIGKKMSSIFDQIWFLHKWYKHFRWRISPRWPSFHDGRGGGPIRRSLQGHPWPLEEMGWQKGHWHSHHGNGFRGFGRRSCHERPQADLRIHDLQFLNASHRSSKFVLNRIHLTLSWTLAQKIRLRKRHMITGHQFCCKDFLHVWRHSQYPNCIQVLYKHE